MKKQIFLALLSFTSFYCYAQTSQKAVADTLTVATPIEMWEYKTIYVGKYKVT